MLLWVLTLSKMSPTMVKPRECRITQAGKMRLKSTQIKLENMTSSVNICAHSWSELDRRIICVYLHYPTAWLAVSARLNSGQPSVNSAFPRFSLILQFPVCYVFMKYSTFPLQLQSAFVNTWTWTETTEVTSAKRCSQIDQQTPPPAQQQKLFRSIFNIALRYLFASVHHWELSWAFSKQLQTFINL